MKTRHFSNFFAKVGDLAAYYQVPNVKITATQENESSYRIKYQSETPYVPLFSPEIGHYIASFLKRQTVVCVVVYPKDYPFRPPIWTAFTRDDGIVRHHNKEYDVGWDPTYTVDKDILLMLIRYLNL
jgi:hypothetical protein